jgi:hypothetical protein
MMTQKLMSDTELPAGRGPTLVTPVPRTALGTVRLNMRFYG